MAGFMKGKATRTAPCFLTSTCITQRQPKGGHEAAADWEGPGNDKALVPLMYMKCSAAQLVTLSTADTS